MKMSLLEQLQSQQPAQQNRIPAESIVIQTFDPARHRKALKDLEGPLEPLFYAKHPTTLMVADMPPALGGKPRKVPLAEYCKEEKFTWVGTPLIHQKRRHHLFGLPSEMSVETHALQYWFHGKDDLLIANLDINQSETAGATHETLEHIIKITDLKVTTADADGNTVKDYAAAAVALPSTVKVGKGVFYYPASNSPLKIGNCVGIYSGVIQSSAENANFYPYGFRAGQDQQPSNLFAQNYATGFFDAQEYGDYTRFFQHAPTEAELAQITMPNHLKALVATANLLPTCGIHTPIPTITFISRRNINPNEQLLYSYGNYWKDLYKSSSGGGSYALFDLAGEIIGTVDVNNQFTVNKSYQHTGKKPAPRCDSSANQIATNQLRAMTAINNDYREIFLENIRFIVNFHANRKTTAGANFYSKAELAIIAMMQDLCKSNNPEHVLYKMDDIREDISKNPQAKNLLALSLELCGHMMYYQCQRGLVASAQKQLSASQKKSAQPLHVAKLDQPVINAIYRSLKAATGNNKWQIDSQQNFCLVASKESLAPIMKHLTGQGLQPVIAPFPNTEEHCLRVKAAHLNNKELKPIQSSATSSSQQIMGKK